LERAVGQCWYGAPCRSMGRRRAEHGRRQARTRRRTAGGNSGAAAGVDAIRSKPWSSSWGRGTGRPAAATGGACRRFLRGRRSREEARRGPGRGSPGDVAPNGTPGNEAGCTNAPEPWTAGGSPVSVAPPWTRHTAHAPTGPQLGLPPPRLAAIEHMWAHLAASSAGRSESGLGGRGRAWHVGWLQVFVGIQTE
jgi:hypothetical protein